jgi:hypothetical protein
MLLCVFILDPCATFVTPPPLPLSPVCFLLSRKPALVLLFLSFLILKKLRNSRMIPRPVPYRKDSIFHSIFHPAYFAIDESMFLMSKEVRPSAHFELFRLV